MKSSSISLLAIAPLFTLIQATGTLQLDVVSKRGYHPVRRQLYKRGDGDDADEVKLAEDPAYTRYYANVTVGTPGQNLQLVVDTGSSDIWLVAKDAEVNVPAWDFPKGTPGGTFDISQSTSASDPYIDGLNITYLDKAGASGDLFADSLSIAGTTIDNYLMGLADKATMGRGILGLGFGSLLSFSDYDDINSEGKKNLVDAMVEAKQISSQAYSLWLNDLESSSGSLLFGGVDTEKFEGNLSSIAIYPTPGTDDIDHFTVSFTSLKITMPDGSFSMTPSDLALPAILDSGSTQTIVPDDIAQAIYAQTGATYFPAFNVAAVPCSLRDVEGSFDFGFGGPNGPVIKVPINEMIYPGIFNGSSLNLPNTTQQACVFGITPASTRGLRAGQPVPFGDTFLRSAYVVYDLANKRIGLAQTKPNATDSEIVKFESQGAPIPHATTVSDERAFTVTEYKPVTFTQPTPVFTGVVGGAFAAAYTGELEVKQTGVRSSTKPTSTADGDKESAGARTRPESIGGMIALGWAVVIFAIGGSAVLL